MLNITHRNVTLSDVYSSGEYVNMYCSKPSVQASNSSSLLTMMHSCLSLKVSPCMIEMACSGVSRAVAESAHCWNSSHRNA